MTLPAAPQKISMANVNTEVGVPATTIISMAWVKSKTKDAANSISQLHSRAYFASDMLGNCDNGNCTASGANCGNVNCVNCLLSAINCANCDGTTKYLQANCNCTPTYNCDQTTRSYNCNCNCTCDCAFSDDRLKNRYETITSALDKVRALTGFFYTGNDTAGRLGLDISRDVGVSAQDVSLVMPEALGNKIGDTYLSVRYERLVPLLIEAIKELDSKISKL